jgi:hypothetical protein
MYSSTLGRWMQQDPMGYVDGQNLYEYVGSSALSNIDPSGLAILTDAKGNVVRWHSYEQMRWMIRKYLTSGKAGDQATGQRWRGAYESLWAFAQGNLPARGDGMPIWDKQNATRVAPEGPKMTPMATFRSDIMTVKSYEVDLHLGVQEGAIAKIREVVESIKKERGAGGAKCSGDLIMFIGHTPTYFYGDPTATDALQGQGIAFLPISCYARRILAGSSKFGFEGIYTPKPPATQPTTRPTSRPVDITNGLMRDASISDEGILLDAIRGLEIVDQWARTRFSQYKSLNVHVIWGSSEPNWETNVGIGTTTVTLP